HDTGATAAAIEINKAIDNYRKITRIEDIPQNITQKWVNVSDLLEGIKRKPLEDSILVEEIDLLLPEGISEDTLNNIRDLQTAQNKGFSEVRELSEVLEPEERDSIVEALIPLISESRMHPALEDAFQILYVFQAIGYDVFSKVFDKLQSINLKPQERLNLIHLLGVIGSEKAIPELMVLLTAGNKELNHAIIWTLSEIIRKNSAKAVEMLTQERRIDGLFIVLRKGNLEIRAEVVRLLSMPELKGYKAFATVLSHYLNNLERHPKRALPIELDNLLSGKIERNIPAGFFKDGPSEFKSIMDEYFAFSVGEKESGKFVSANPIRLDNVLGVIRDEKISIFEGWIEDRPIEAYNALMALKTLEWMRIDDPTKKPVMDFIRKYPGLIDRLMRSRSWRKSREDISGVEHLASGERLFKTKNTGAHMPVDSALPPQVVEEKIAAGARPTVASGERLWLKIIGGAIGGLFTWYTVKFIWSFGLKFYEAAAKGLLDNAAVGTGNLFWDIFTAITAGLFIIIMGSRLLWHYGNKVKVIRKILGWKKEKLESGIVIRRNRIGGIEVLGRDRRSKRNLKIGVLKNFIAQDLREWIKVEKPVLYMQFGSEIEKFRLDQLIGIFNSVEDSNVTKMTELNKHFREESKFANFGGKYGPVRLFYIMYNFAMCAMDPLINYRFFKRNKWFLSESELEMALRVAIIAEIRKSRIKEKSRFAGAKFMTSLVWRSFGAIPVRATFIWIKERGGLLIRSTIGRAILAAAIVSILSLLGVPFGGVPLLMKFSFISPFAGILADVPIIGTILSWGYLEKFFTIPNLGGAYMLGFLGLIPQYYKYHKTTLLTEDLTKKAFDPDWKGPRIKRLEFLEILNFMKEIEAPLLSQEELIKAIAMLRTALDTKSINYDKTGFLSKRNARYYLSYAIAHLEKKIEPINRSSYEQRVNELIKDQNRARLSAVLPIIGMTFTSRIPQQVEKGLLRSRGHAVKDRLIFRQGFTSGWHIALVGPEVDGLTGLSHRFDGVLGFKFTGQLIDRIEGHETSVMGIGNMIVQDVFAPLGFDPGSLIYDSLMGEDAPSYSDVMNIGEHIENVNSSYERYAKIGRLDRLMDRLENGQSLAGKEIEILSGFADEEIRKIGHVIETGSVEEGKLEKARTYRQFLNELVDDLESRKVVSKEYLFVANTLIEGNILKTGRSHIISSLKQGHTLTKQEKGLLSGLAETRVMELEAEIEKHKLEGALKSLGNLITERRAFIESFKNGKLSEKDIEIAGQLIDYDFSRIAYLKGEIREIYARAEKAGGVDTALADTKDEHKTEKDLGLPVFTGKARRLIDAGKIKIEPKAPQTQQAEVSGTPPPPDKKQLRGRFTETVIDKYIPPKQEQLNQDRVDDEKTGILQLATKGDKRVDPYPVMEFRYDYKAMVEAAIKGKLLFRPTSGEDEGKDIRYKTGLRFEYKDWFRSGDFQMFSINDDGTVGDEQHAMEQWYRRQRVFAYTSDGKDRLTTSQVLEYEKGKLEIRTVIVPLSVVDINAPEIQDKLETLKGALSLGAHEIVGGQNALRLKAQRTIESEELTHKLKAIKEIIYEGEGTIEGKEFKGKIRAIYRDRDNFVSRVICQPDKDKDEIEIWDYDSTAGWKRDTDTEDDIRTNKKYIKYKKEGIIDRTYAYINTNAEFAVKAGYSEGRGVQYRVVSEIELAGRPVSEIFEKDSDRIIESNFNDYRKAEAKDDIKALIEYINRQAATLFQHVSVNSMTSFAGEEIPMFEPGKYLRGLTLWGVEHLGGGWVKIFNTYKDLPKPGDVFKDEETGAIYLKKKDSQGNVICDKDDQGNIIGYEKGHLIEYGLLAPKMQLRLLQASDRNSMALMLGQSRDCVIRLDLNTDQTKIFTGRRMYDEFLNIPEDEIVYRDAVTNSYIWQDGGDTYLISLVSGVKRIAEDKAKIAERLQTAIDMKDRGLKFLRILEELMKGWYTAVPAVSQPSTLPDVSKFIEMFGTGLTPRQTLEQQLLLRTLGYPEEQEEVMPQGILLAGIEYVHPDGNVMPTVLFRWEGVSADKADFLIKYGMGGLAKLQNPLFANIKEEKACLDGYLKQLEWYRDKDIMDKIYSGDEDKYVPLDDEIEKVKAELAKLDKADKEIQSYIWGGKIGAEAQVPGTGCVVALYINAFTQGGADFEDRDRAEVSLAIVMDNKEVYVTQSLGDRYKSFNGFTPGEGRNVREYGFKYSKDLKIADVNLGFSLKSFVLNDENGKQLGIAFPITANNIKIPGIGITLQGGLTVTAPKDYKTILVGRLEAAKKIYGQNLIMVVGGTNRGDMAYTFGITNERATCGLLLNASKRSGEPGFTTTTGDLYTTIGHGFGASFYADVWKALGFKISASTYKDKDFLGEIRRNLVLKGEVALNINEPSAETLEYLRRQESKAFLKAYKAPIEQVEEKKEAPEKPAIPKVEEESQEEKLATTEEIRKIFDELGIEEKDLSQKIRKEFEEDTRKKISLKKLITTLDWKISGKPGEKDNPAQREGYIETLFNLLTDTDKIKDFTPEEEKALRSDYAQLIGAEYYKNLLTAVATTKNYQKVFDLYCYFINGAFKEEGINQGVLDAKAELDQLFEKGKTENDDEVKSALKIFKSRMIMTPPEEFHWQYVDLLHGRMAWSDFKLSEGARIRYEDIRIFFERYKEVDNGRTRLIDINGKKIPCIAFDVEYSMITKEELEAGLKPRKGLRREYYEYDKVSKTLRKLADVEEIKDAWVLYYKRTDPGLEGRIARGQAPYTSIKTSFQLITYHYYIEATNIERSYQKVVVWGDNAKGILFDDEKGRRQAVQGKGRRQAVELGILGINPLGRNQTLNIKGNMLMDVKLAYEPLHNSSVRRAELDKFGETALIKRLEGIIDKQDLVLIQRFKEYTKEMDARGADARLEDDDPRLDKDGKLRRAVQHYKTMVIEPGDKAPYPYVKNRQAYEMPEGDPTWVDRQLRAERFEKMIERNMIRIKPEVTDENRASHSIDPELALEQRDTARIDLVTGVKTFLSRSYLGASGWLGRLEFLFDLSLEGILNVYAGKDPDRLAKLRDFVMSKDRQRNKGLLYNAFNVETHESEEKDNPNVNGPNAWEAIWLAHDIEKNGDPDNKKIDYLKDKADSLLALGEGHTVFVNNMPLPALIIPLGPDNRNTASTEHHIDFYVLFRYLGEKIPDADGQRYRDAAKQIANLLRAPISGGGLYLEDDGFFGLVFGRLVRGIRDISRFKKGDIGGTAGKESIDYTASTDTQAWIISLIAAYPEDFEGLDPRTFINYADDNCKAKAEDKGGKFDGFDFMYINQLNFEIRMAQLELIEIEETAKYNGRVFSPYNSSLRRLNLDELEKARSDELIKKLNDIGVDVTFNFGRDFYPGKDSWRGIYDKEEVWIKIRGVKYSKEIQVLKPMIAVEWTNYMVTAYRTVAGWVEDEGGGIKNDIERLKDKLQRELYDDEIAEIRNKAKELAEYYRRAAEFYKNEVDKMITMKDGIPELSYATMGGVQKADNKEDISPPMVPSASAIITRAFLDMKTEDGKFFDPLIIKVRHKVKGDLVPLPLDEKIRAIKPSFKQARYEGRIEPDYLILSFGPDEELHTENLMRYLKGELALDTESLGLDKSFARAGNKAVFEGIYGKGISIPDLIEMLQDPTKAGYFYLVKDNDKLKVSIMSGGKALPSLKVTIDNAAMAMDAVRSKVTSTPISYNGATEAKIRKLSYLFDGAVDGIFNIYADRKEVVSGFIDFLINRSVKKSYLFPSAYDVAFGNMQEYSNPGGPNAWTDMMLGHFVEKFIDKFDTDKDDRITNKEFLLLIENADASLGLETQYTTMDGRRAGIFTLGPGQGAAATEHILDHFVRFNYLGEKIEGEDRFEKAAKRIAVFLSTPVEKGGAYMAKEGRFIRGIKDIHGFIRAIRQGRSPGRDSVDDLVATDVQAWGASVVAIYPQHFKGLSPCTFVDFAEKYCSVTVDFNGARVTGFDFVDKTLRDFVTRNNIRLFIKEHGRSPSQKELETITRKEMISVEWTNYMITAYLHAAEWALNIDKDQVRSAYYRSQADKYKAEIDKLTITRTTPNGDVIIGLPYATSSYMQKSDNPDDRTPKNCENSISVSATITRAMLDLKAEDGKFFDPLRLKAEKGREIKHSALPEVKIEIIKIKPSIIKPSRESIGFLVTNAYRYAPGFIRASDKPNIHEYLKGCRIYEEETGSSETPQATEKSEYMSVQVPIKAEKSGVYVFRRGDGKALGFIEDDQLTIIQRDALYGREIYRETYKLTENRITSLSKRIMPMEMDYIIDKLKHTLDRYQGEFTGTGKGKIFKDPDDYKKTFLNSFNKAHAVEEEDSKGIKNIAFYIEEEDSKGIKNKPLALILNNKFLVELDIGKIDIIDYDEKRLLTNLREKTPEIFGTQRKYRKFVSQLTDVKNLRIAPTIEIDVNHPSRPQYYTNFIQTKGGTRQDIARLQKGDFGFSVDIVEHTKKNGKIIKSQIDQGFNEIIGDMERSTQINPTIRNIVVGEGRSAQLDVEFAAWLEQFGDKNIKDIEAHRIFTISDNGTGGIKKKKGYTEVYSGEQKVLQIDKHGFGIIDPSDVRHTFKYKDNEIGEYTYRSHMNTEGETVIKNIVIDRTHRQREEDNYEVITFDLMDRDGNKAKGISYKIPEDMRFRLIDIPIEGEKEYNFELSDGDDYDFVYFYIEGLDRNRKIELEITGQINGKEKKIIVSSDEERLDEEDVISFWTPLLRNKISNEMLRPDKSKTKAVYAIEAPYDLIENMRVVSIEALKHAGIDKVTKIVLKDINDLGKGVRVSGLQYVGDGSSIGGELSDKEFKLMNVYDKDKSMVSAYLEEGDELTELTTDGKTFMIKALHETKVSKYPHVWIFDITSESELAEPLFAIDPYNGKLITLNKLGIDRESKDKTIGIYRLYVNEGIVEVKGYNPKLIEDSDSYSAYGKAEWTMILPYKDDFRNRVATSLFYEMSKKFFRSDYTRSIGFGPLKLTAQEVADKINEVPDVGYIYHTNTDITHPWEKEDYSKKDIKIAYDKLPLELRPEQETPLFSTDPESSQAPVNEYVDIVKELEVYIPYLLSTGSREDLDKAAAIMEFLRNKHKEHKKEHKNGFIRTHYHRSRGIPVEYDLENKMVRVSDYTAQQQLATSTAGFRVAQRSSDPDLLRFSIDMLEVLLGFQSPKGGFTEKEPEGLRQLVDGVITGPAEELNYYPIDLNAKTFLFLSRLQKSGIFDLLPEALKVKVAQRKTGLEEFLREHFLTYARKRGTIIIGAREVRGTEFEALTAVALEKWNSAEGALWFIEAATEMKDVTQEELNTWFSNVADIFGVELNGKWGIDWSPVSIRLEGRAISPEVTAHFLRVAKLLKDKNIENFTKHALNSYEVSKGMVPEVIGVRADKVKDLDGIAMRTGQGSEIVLNETGDKTKKWPASKAATITIINADNGNSLYDISDEEAGALSLQKEKEVLKKGFLERGFFTKNIFGLALLVQLIILVYNCLSWFVWRIWGKGRENGEEYYTKVDLRWALKELSTEVFGTQSYDIVRITDSDIEGAFLAYLVPIYALIHSWNEKSGNKISITDLNNFSLDMVNYLARQLSIGAGDGTRKTVKYPKKGEVDTEVWAYLHLYLADCFRRMRQDFDKGGEFKKLVEDDIGVSKGTFDPGEEVGFIKRLLKKDKARHTDYTEFKKKLPKPINPHIDNFISFLPRFILSTIGVLWHIGAKAGIHIFAEFGSMLTDSLPTLVIPGLNIAIPVIFAIAIGMLAIVMIHEFYSMATFTDGKSHLRKIPGIIFIGVSYFMFTSLSMPLFEIAVLKFLVGVLFGLEGLYNLISNRSIFGLAFYNLFRPSIGPGKPRLFILQTLRVLGLIGISILLANAVSGWFVEQAVNTWNIVSAGILFYIVQVLVDYGLWQHLTTIASLLFPMRGSMFEKESAPAGWDPGKTGVLFISGNPMRSMAWHEKENDQGVKVVFTPELAAKELFNKLKYLLDNEDSAASGFIRGIQKVLKDKYPDDPDVNLIDWKGRVNRENVIKLFTLLYKAEKDSDITLWDLDQLTAGAGIDNDLKVHCDKNDRDKIIQAWWLRDWICDMTSPEGRTNNTATNLIKIAKELKKKIGGENIVFYIIHNQFSDFDKGGPSASSLSNIEIKQRKKLCRLINQVSGANAYTIYNSTTYSFKAAAMNAIISVPEELEYLKSLVITDRNAKVGNVEQYVKDIERVRNNPDLAIVIANRGTTDVTNFTGDFNRLVEEGYDSYLLGLGGEKSGTGWMSIMQIPYWETLVKLGKRDYPETTLTKDTKGLMNRLFGTMLFFPNAIGISEDYWAVVQTAYMQIGLGRIPKYGITKAFGNKLREAHGLYEFIKAHVRWAVGYYQTQADYVMQRIQEYGPESVFERDARRASGLHFLIPIWGLINIIALPLAIMGNFTAFVGINLLFWTLGTVFNQIETGHGLLATLRGAGWVKISVRTMEIPILAWIGFITGFILGWSIVVPMILPPAAPLVWAALIAFYSGIISALIFESLPGGFSGWSNWLSRRVRDMIGASPRFILFAITQIGAIFKAPSCEFKVSEAGKGGGAFRNIWIRWDEFKARDLQDVVSELGTSFKVIAVIGTVMFILNLWAMPPLGLLNVVMLWISLVFMSGGLIGTYVLDQKQGASFGKGLSDVLAKIAGYGAGISILMGLAIKIGGGFIGLANLVLPVIIAIVALTAAADLITKTIKTIPSDESKDEIDHKILKHPYIQRVSSEMMRGFITSLFLFGWFLLVSVAVSWSFDLGPKFIEFTGMKLLSYISIPIKIGFAMVIAGNIQTRIMKWIYTAILNKKMYKIRNNEALINELEPLVTQAWIFIHQGQFGKIRENLRAIDKKIGSNEKTRSASSNDRIASNQTNAKDILKQPDGSKYRINILDAILNNEKRSYLDEILDDADYICASLKNIHHVKRMPEDIIGVNVKYHEQGGAKIVYRVEVVTKNGSFIFALKRARDVEKGISFNELRDLEDLSERDAPVPKYGVRYVKGKVNLAFSEEFIEGDMVASIPKTYKNVKAIVKSWMQVTVALRDLRKRNDYIVVKDMQPNNIMLNKKDNKFIVVDIGLTETRTPFQILREFHRHYGVSIDSIKGIFKGVIDILGAKDGKLFLREALINSGKIKPSRLKDSDKILIIELEKFLEENRRIDDRSPLEDKLEGKPLLKFVQFEEENKVSSNTHIFSSPVKKTLSASSNNSLASGDNISRRSFIGDLLTILAIIGTSIGTV
ncbi:MAG: hypothetical protein KKG01_07670, partial [Candidatus Omnitrophica bacterium]|nr:hypothetical protein [Candidatus Omnitrophota bacterium]